MINNPISMVFHEQTTMQHHATGPRLGTTPEASWNPGGHTVNICKFYWKGEQPPTANHRVSGNGVYMYISMKY